MRATQIRRGFITYEMDEEDYRRQAAERLAALQAQTLDDTAAVQVAGLFPRWAAGVTYAKDARITDGKGNLYKVVQSHTSQADWPIDATPALYTALGVTEADPDAVPAWKQPTGAHDAYNRGDRVVYQGQIYESLLDGNTFSPDVYPAGWAAVERAK